MTPDYQRQKTIFERTGTKRKPIYLFFFFNERVIKQIHFFIEPLLDPVWFKINRKTQYCCPK